MASTAYSRPSKPPGPAAGERRGPRLAKELGRIEPKKLGIGLVAGCCLALLTYLSFARLFAIYSPVFDSTSLVMKNAPPSTTTVPATEAQPVQQESQVEEDKDVPDPETDPKMPNLPETTRRNEQKEATVTKPSGGDVEAKIICDENGVDEGFPYARPPVCELAGDIRICPKEKTMFFVNPSGTGPFDANGEKKIRPFARKDDFLLPGVVEVTIKSVSSTAAMPQCTRRHDVPAVIFSVAGYTDNFFHDNTDVLIPLFLTTSHLKGEVQFLITNFKPWWVHKFTPLLKKLSNYEVINFDKDEEVHCFRRGHLGLYRDRDLIISPHPTRNPHNYSMVDYNRFLRRAFGLPRDAPAVLGEETGEKPKMLIIERKGTRKLLNLREVSALCENLGFSVTVAEAGGDVRGFAERVNAADVLLAVHGAGLTNQIFLPTGAVLVQIVPWGKMDWMATNFYGQPARDMRLRYVEYYVSEEETTLKDKYPRDHYVFKDPMHIHAQGWPAIADIIMKQDVTVNMTRFKPLLLKALDELQE
ncbi:beta-1,2-xylosyltransferease XAX1-like [Phragmites australis]|uniref:beta-1,2-xylosyltransferease XAX1-like n=1 Tax=Phragmites australis TaxID=29695 RepID=UPI002D76E70B|nr:beta-1,2-xylosyltransferease XAX1-like [Phragmites australis]